jgi:hypothetical protein
VLSLAVLAFRGDPAKDAGLVLRHENAAVRAALEGGVITVRPPACGRMGGPVLVL